MFERRTARLNAPPPASNAHAVAASALLAFRADPERMLRRFKAKEEAEAKPETEREVEKAEPCEPPNDDGGGDTEYLATLDDDTDEERI